MGLRNSSTSGYTTSSSTHRPRCDVAGCSRGALTCDSKAGMILFSLYCKDHACRQRIGDVMCPNAKVLGPAKFCDDHRLCNCRGCDEPRIAGETNQDFAYCHQHTCQTKACRRKAEPDSNMCPPHTPRCLVPSCGAPRADAYPGCLFCTAHRCSHPSCDGVIHAGPWCRAHGFCAAPGCSEPRCPAVAAPGPTGGVGSEQAPLCQIHMTKKCARPGCNALGALAHCLFCPTHECAAPQCRLPRDDLADKSRLYCTDHTCLAPACPNGRPASAAYCCEHACTSAGCRLPARGPAPSTCAPGPPLCALHACTAAGCRAPRAADPTCVPEALLCIAHQCRAPDCLAPRTAWSRLCAAAHGCVRTACSGARVPGLPLCTPHILEVARQMDEDDEDDAAALSPPSRGRVRNKRPRGRNPSFDSGIGRSRSDASERTCIV